MAFTLIVKGSKGFVISVLLRRNINYTSVEQHPKFNECIVRATPDTPWSDLAAWFCEHTREGAPFPSGTLLWYGPWHGPDIVPKEGA